MQRQEAPPCSLRKDLVQVFRPVAGDNEANRFFSYCIRCSTVFFGGGPGRPA